MGVAYIPQQCIYNSWQSSSLLQVTQQCSLLQPEQLQPPGGASAHLEKCSCHVENNENRGECSVSTLHGADGVKENQVSRHDQKEEHTGRAGIHICWETKVEFRLQWDGNTAALQPTYSWG